MCLDFVSICSKQLKPLLSLINNILPLGCKIEAGKTVQICMDQLQNLLKDYMKGDLAVFFQ